MTGRLSGPLHVFFPFPVGASFSGSSISSRSFSGYPATSNGWLSVWSRVQIITFPFSRWFFGFAISIHQKKWVVATQRFLMFTPKIGEMIPILTNIFQLGWFNHQLENGLALGYKIGFCASSHHFKDFQIGVSSSIKNQIKQAPVCVYQKNSGVRATSPSISGTH